MSLAEELLALAIELAAPQDRAPTQASLRRAVSTAYYALFHLLISELTINYARAELRPELGRVFSHGKMKDASVETRKVVQPRRETNPLARHLYLVTDAFIGLQDKRIHADYDTGRDWDQTDVMKLVADAGAGFEAWREIRDEAAAQVYLVALLGSKGPDFAERLRILLAAQVDPVAGRA